MSHEVPIRLEDLVRRGVYTLLGIEVVLGCLDLVFAFNKVIDVRVIQRLFNTAREDGLGTWFGSTQALLVALLLGAIAAWIRRTAPADRAGVWGFGLIASFFAYLSADDALGIHERIGGALKRATFSGDAEWFPSYSWQLMLAPLFAAFGVFILFFLWRRLSTGLRPFLVAALGAYAIAVGIDFVEGIDEAFEGIADGIGVSTYTVSHLSKVTEELLEMAGTTGFLGVAGMHLSALLSGGRLVFERTV